MVFDAENRGGWRRRRLTCAVPSLSVVSVTDCNADEGVLSCRGIKRSPISYHWRACSRRVITREQEPSPEAGARSTLPASNWWSNVYRQSKESDLLSVDCSNPFQRVLHKSIRIECRIRGYIMGHHRHAPWASPLVWLLVLDRCQEMQLEISLLATGNTWSVDECNASPIIVRVPKADDYLISNVFGYLVRLRLFAIISGVERFKLSSPMKYYKRCLLCEPEIMSMTT